MMHLINAPDYANDYEFIVARQIDNDFWFWGAYTDGFKAEQVAIEIGGVVMHNLHIQGKR